MRAHIPLQFRRTDSICRSVRGGSVREMRCSACAAGCCSRWVVDTGDSSGRQRPGVRARRGSSRGEGSVVHRAVDLRRPADPAPPTRKETPPHKLEQVCSRQTRPRSGRCRGCDTPGVRPNGAGILQLRAGLRVIGLAQFMAPWKGRIRLARPAPLDGGIELRSFRARRVRRNGGFGRHCPGPTH